MLSLSQTSTAATRTHQLANGITIVAEPMPGKRAAAWAFLIPAGSATEPPGREGLTSVLEGLSYRGAGGRNSRELSDALDDLGIDRGGGSDVEYTTYGGATLGDYLADALTVYADIIRRPQLPADEWEAQRDLALQALDSLEDAPARKMFVQLRRLYFPDNYGRSPYGTREGLNALTLEDLRRDHAARFRPAGAIIALAGNLDFEAIVSHLETLFGDWQGAGPKAEQPHPVPQPVYHHIVQETAQEQIGVAYPGVPSTDPDFYNHRVATSVLSGGMGARLFTEVREKRGLVYSVSASAATLRGCGFNLAYAGTTPERSQETLDVLIGELQRIADGVTPDEVERAKIGMLSSLVMQEESSRARAGAIARDQFMLGRVRSLDEITEAINAVTPDTIAAFYAAHPPRDFTVVTLGPKELTVPR
ncbi:MAG: insulinase family protein [Abitibacteriaceae bacterium]|nr:insulinase family protein [Abditibacteriaceae bacterium]MBV9864914.1 insulinase family protein [Abditibacteriaceae bacterium]